MRITSYAGTEAEYAIAVRKENDELRLPRSLWREAPVSTILCASRPKRFEVNPGLPRLDF